MQFLTKQSLKGLGTAGNKRVDPFAALRQRRLKYAGRSRMQTGMGNWPTLYLPKLAVIPPELTITPEGRLEFEAPRIQPTGEMVSFPGTQEPTPLPSLPREAVTDMYDAVAEQNNWEAPGLPANEVPPPGFDQQLPVPEATDAAAVAGGFAEKLKAAIKAYPTESVAIAIFGAIAGAMILSVLRGGID